MGKQLWRWLSLLLVGLSLGLAATQVAHADYTISPYHMQVDVAKNGDATVRQSMTYRFDDDYHGVFNVQDIRGIRGGKLERVTASLNGQRAGIAYPATTGAPLTYQLSQNAERMKVKLFQPVSDGDRLTVTYRFKLTGVVTNYRDTAELNWRVIGSGWSEPLHKVRVTIQLPAKSITHLQAWTHGPLDGHTTVDKQAGRVTMTVAENPEESFVESHLLFPTTVTPTAHRVDQKRKAAAQQQEAKLVEQANATRRKNRRLLVGSFLGVWVLSLIWALVAWFRVKRHPANRYPHPIPIPHFFDVPSVSPAMAESLLDFQSPTTDALSGEILMAATHKEISLVPEKDGRHDTMRLTLLKPTTNAFLAKCFEKVATDGQSFTLRDLKKYGKRDKKGRMGKWFQSWQNQVNEAAEAYQDGANVALRSRLTWTGWGISVLLVIATGLGWFISRPVGQWGTGLAAVLLIGLWVVISWVRRQTDRYNAEGLVVVNEVGGFRRMLKDIGHFNTAKIGDLILWEEILPYAAAFGLAQQVADKLAVDFGETALQAGFVGFYPWYFVGTANLSGSLSDSLSTGIAGALKASDNQSSSTGGSGGFSGGSSGGFGGGSGGGAF